MIFWKIHLVTCIFFYYLYPCHIKFQKSPCITCNRGSKVAVLHPPQILASQCFPERWSAIETRLFRWDWGCDSFKRRFVNVKILKNFIGWLHQYVIPIEKIQIVRSRYWLIWLAPLIFSSYGGYGREADRFLSTLADKLSLKKDISYGETVAWLRTKLSFCLLRSAILCVRGSRSVKKTTAVNIDSTKLTCSESRLM